MSTINALGHGAYVRRRSSVCSRQLDVHVFDLRREVRPHLGPFHFERRCQQAVLHGERVRVQVDVFHLQRNGRPDETRDSRRGRRHATLIIIIIIMTSQQYVTCSNDFRPPSLPQAVMSSIMSFLTSGLAHSTDSVPDIPFSCAQRLMMSTTGTTMAMMHD